MKISDFFNQCFQLIQPLDLADLRLVHTKVSEKKTENKSNFQFDEKEAKRTFECLTRI